jgi:hypothetical protein
MQGIRGCFSQASKPATIRFMNIKSCNEEKKSEKSSQNRFSIFTWSFFMANIVTLNGSMIIQHLNGLPIVFVVLV